MTVGILALQGGYEAHAKVLESLSATWKYIREPEHLAEVKALILPGGESSTLLRLLQKANLFTPIQTFGQRSMPILGTCAGSILLAKEVNSPEQESFGLMDICVTRNAYGRQLASKVVFGNSGIKDPMEMVFIRAPQIKVLSDQVDVLAVYEGRPVCVQQGNCIAVSFHPELSQDTSLHRYFLNLA